MNIQWDQIITATASAEVALAAARTAALGNLVAQIDAITDLLTGNVPLAEKPGWAAKEEAARAILGGVATEAQTALIANEADVQGEDVRTLATRVVAKADTYRTAIARLTGQRRKVEASIDAASDPSGVEAALKGATLQPFFVGKE